MHVSLWNLLQSYTLRGPFAAPSQQDLGGRQKFLLWLLLLQLVGLSVGMLFPCVPEWSAFLFPLFVQDFFKKQTLHLHS